MLATFLLGSAFAGTLIGAYAESAPVEVERFYHEVDGINYYLEKRGSGPYFVMVTSGQGDSGAYAFLADILATR